MSLFFMSFMRCFTITFFFKGVKIKDQHIHVSSPIQKSVFASLSFHYSSLWIWFKEQIIAPDDRRKRGKMRERSQICLHNKAQGQREGREMWMGGKRLGGGMTGESL